MKKISIILILIVSFLFVGCTNNEEINQQSKTVTTEKIEKNTIDEPIDKVETDQLETENTSEEILEDSIENTEPITNSNVETKSNKILFENSYREFSNEEFNLAKESNYYIILDFYSSWCPKCNSEDSILSSSFNDLENIVIFKVNHGDSQTSEEEKQLAEDFDVSNRATGIVLKGSEEISRYSGHKNENQYGEIFNSLS